MCPGVQRGGPHASGLETGWQGPGGRRPEAPLSVAFPSPSFSSSLAECAQPPISKPSSLLQPSVLPSRSCLLQNLERSVTTCLRGWLSAQRVVRCVRSRTLCGAPSAPAKLQERSSCGTRRRCWCRLLGFCLGPWTPLGSPLTGGCLGKQEGELDGSSSSHLK